MCVTENVKQDFLQRKEKIIALIQEYNVGYKEVGIFGSFARNDYKATSDIDFCIITEHRPDRRVSGALREDAEILKADIIFVTPVYFETDDSEFAKQLRRDYRRIL